jgi:NAD(P)H-quinone oxidoreductase subunit 5
MMPVHLVWLAPLLMIAAAVTAFAGKGFRPRGTIILVEIASLTAVAIGIGAIAIVSVNGPQTAELATAAGFGASLRIDAVSVTMLALVSFVGWVVLRYSGTYLDGEERQGPFLGWMSLTLAAVMVLVTAGNVLQLTLAWAAMAAGLHRLLLFYPRRPAARRAARKKAMTTGMGLVALASASALLSMTYGTGDIAGIGRAAAANPTAAGVIGAGLLATAALFKTAQFPVQGWLTEVMEAPTPVSALLHAGVVNAGGFLLVRFADVMIGAPGVLAVLVILGGFTALVGSLVMLTQPAVKTALAWSTIAQMGFMILQCGLALFPLALLHIVAHSLYKAHAFLSSGEAVAAVNGLRKPGPVAVPGLGAVARSFALALVLYVAVAAGVSALVGQKSPQALALGAMLIFGVSYLIAQGLADAAPGALTRRTVAASLGAALAYFGFHVAAQALWGPSLPPVPAAGALEWALIVLTVLSFGLVAFAQSLFPVWAQHPSTAGLRVHLANGLYLNALLDRLIGGFGAPGKS